MATLQAPTFAGSALCDTGQRERDGSIEVRIFTENIPGVDGEFAQPHGHGGRTVVVTGILECVADNTRADALDTGHVTLRAKQSVLCDGATVGTFVDTAGRSHSNCIVISYEPTGPIVVVPHGAEYRSIIPIRAVIRMLDP